MTAALKPKLNAGNMNWLIIVPARLLVICFKTKSLVELGRQIGLTPVKEPASDLRFGDAPLR